MKTIQSLEQAARTIIINKGKLEDLRLLLEVSRMLIKSQATANAAINLAEPEPHCANLLCLAANNSRQDILELFLDEIENNDFYTPILRVEATLPLLNFAIERKNPDIIILLFSHITNLKQYYKGGLDRNIYLKVLDQNISPNPAIKCFSLDIIKLFLLGGLIIEDNINIRYRLELSDLLKTATFVKNAINSILRQEYFQIYANLIAAIQLDIDFSFLFITSCIQRAIDQNNGFAPNWGDTEDYSYVKFLIPYFHDCLHLIAASKYPAEVPASTKTLLTKTREIQEKFADVIVGFCCTYIGKSPRAAIKLFENQEELLDFVKPYIANTLFAQTLNAKPENCQKTELIAMPLAASLQKGPLAVAQAAKSAQDLPRLSS